MSGMTRVVIGEEGLPGKTLPGSRRARIPTDRRPAPPAAKIPYRRHRSGNPLLGHFHQLLVGEYHPNGCASAVARGEIPRPGCRIPRQRGSGSRAAPSTSESLILIFSSMGGMDARGSGRLADGKQATREERFRPAMEFALSRCTGQGRMVHPTLSGRFRISGTAPVGDPWTLRSNWVTGNSRGVSGRRRRVSPASSGVRFALREFTSRAARTQFSQFVAPPRERGTMWSMLPSPGRRGRPVYSAASAVALPESAGVELRSLSSAPSQSARAPPPWARG